MDNFALYRSWWVYDGEQRTSSRFTGAIDEVEIWKRALSDNEVLAECVGGGPPIV